MNRREAREKTFILVYQYKFHSDCMTEILDRFFEEHSGLGKQKEYIADVVLGTVKHIQEIDGKIEENSKDWKVSRLSTVSLAVMRLAIYEMLYREDIPASVAINEAVSLVKKYEGEEAAPFVNGVLGAIQGGSQIE